MRNPRHFTHPDNSFEGYPPGEYKMYDGQSWYVVIMPEDEDRMYHDPKDSELPEIPVDVVNRWIQALPKQARSFWSYYDEDSGEELRWLTDQQRWTDPE